MNVKFIAHSSFLIEMDKKVLIFDYCKGKLPRFDKEKEVYVFFSHGHEDHFNSEIFDLLSKYEKVFYILSNDIKVEPKENFLFIGPNEERTFRDLYIKTLKSTDIGVAFLIDVDFKKIYHAGDLNWWHWTGESEEYNHLAEVSYKEELNKISNERIDVAFVVLDPRQNNEFYMGLDYFMEITNTSKVYPMHMWNHYEVIDKLKNMICSVSYKDKIVDKSFYLDN